MELIRVAEGRKGCGRFGTRCLIFPMARRLELRIWIGIQIGLRRRKMALALNLRGNRLGAVCLTQRLLNRLSRYLLCRLALNPFLVVLGRKLGSDAMWAVH